MRLGMNNFKSPCILKKKKKTLVNFYAINSQEEGVKGLYVNGVKNDIYLLILLPSHSPFS